MTLNPRKKTKRLPLILGTYSTLDSRKTGLLPCLIGYGIIARRLYDDPSTVREGSKYWKWIEQYVGQEYIDAMVRGSDMIEEQVKKQVSLSISNCW
jgi:thiaminase